MSPRLHTPIAAVLTLAAAPAFAQRSPQAAPAAGPVVGEPVIETHDLSYLEDSAGLQSLGWDGGMTEIMTADLNLDGHLDLVTVGDHGSPFVNTDMHGVTVWFGNGAGGWTLAQTGVFGYGGLDVGDANNDGLPDVAFGVHHAYSSTDLGDQLMEVILGDGSGRAWTPWDDGLALHGQSWGMHGTALFDFDADGWLDVASVAFGCCDGIHAYRNNTDGSWSHTFGILGGNSRMELFTGDVNNDGYPDLVASHQNGTIWLSNGAGGFVSGDANLPPAGSLGRAGASLGDVTGDGHDDLAFTESGGGVRLFAWNPGQLRWDDLSDTLPPASGFSTTRLTDMNADGRVDLVAFGNRQAVVLANLGGGTQWQFEALLTTGSPGDYAALGLGDIDHNGYPDIAVVADEGGIFNSRNKLRLFRETSVPEALWVRVTAPVRHRVHRTGGVAMIDWLAAVPTGLTDVTATVEFSATGPDGPWTLLGADLPNNGRYQTTLSAGPGGSDQCHVRVTVRGLDGQGEEVSARQVSGRFEVRD